MANLLGTFPFNEDIVLQHVLKCLGPRSLLKISCVNTLYERLTCDDFLWKSMTVLLWHNKQIVCTGIVKRPKPRTFPFSKIALVESGYKTLSALELKYILRQRNVDTRGCSEKREFIALATSSSELLLGIPRAFRDKWKASFYTSLGEGHRTRAIKADICTYKWAMTFKQNETAPEWISSFHQDMTLTSEPSMNQGRDMLWSFHGANHEYIRVAQYPPLLITRLEDWGWRMENEYVYFLRTNQKL